MISATSGKRRLPLFGLLLANDGARVAATDAAIGTCVHYRSEVHCTPHRTVGVLHGPQRPDEHMHALSAGDQRVRMVGGIGGIDGELR